MTTPATNELVMAQIPALRLLMAMGWHYVARDDCLAARGGNAGLVLTDVLVEQLKSRRFEYKGETYPLSPNAIDQIVRELSTPRMKDGLGSANEALYNKLTLGITVTEFVGGQSCSPTIPIIDWDTPENNDSVSYTHLTLPTIYSV